MAAGGLSLAQLLASEAYAGRGSSHKAVINVFLPGGPSHLDLFDLKPHAPAEIRGEFRPIRTNISGMEICEHFPRLSKMADKFAVVRGLVGNVDEHSSNTTQTGYGERAMQEIGGAPSVGAVVSKLQGFNGGMAPFVADSVDAKYGYLGPKYQGFRTKLTQFARGTQTRFKPNGDIIESGRPDRFSRTCLVWYH